MEKLHSVVGIRRIDGMKTVDVRRLCFVKKLLERCMVDSLLGCMVT